MSLADPRPCGCSQEIWRRFLQASAHKRYSSESVAAVCLAGGAVSQSGSEVALERHATEEMIWFLGVLGRNNSLADRQYRRAVKR
jgi:hypothetical protein